MQKDVERLSSNDDRMHPIIEYVTNMVVQAGQDGAELDLFSLSLETVEDMCNEAAEGCPTKPGVIHMPNLTALIDQIPLDNQWWVPPTRTHIILFSSISAMT